MPAQDVSVIMLAYGVEEYLGEAVAAVLASEGIEVQLVLVDNGCTSDAVAMLPQDPRIQVLRPAENLGFAGGVNLGALEATSEHLAFVNSDAVVAPDALRILVDEVDLPGRGIVCACVRLADKPELVNSVGNPIHVLGLSWAGGMDEPVAAHQEPRTIASATGACLVVTADLWRSLGGFPDEFFAYVEDLEVSWRVWQRGLTVHYVPAAVADHHYEFSRSPLKMYLVERNRLLFVLTGYGARLLALLALPLLAFEAAIFLIALKEGWWRQKVKGWGWIARNLGWVRQRRRLVQSTRTVPDKDLVHLLTDTFDPAQFPLPAGGGLVQGVLKAYWRVVRRFV
ncbi:glycosyltransferase family 2 protein [Sanguibacter sp. Leaf3]|uniref:glycosyltransferase family 2 protein n=1 Tax=Sanguibacter sp. Leaf3 TaxID=1736209 RepID=UPI000B06CC5F|nr:glycosyltransferase family 2 protein [Sanguibacter sp. Leaf3]